jgi:hypothetical protein
MSDTPPRTLKGWTIMLAHGGYYLGRRSSAVKPLPPGLPEILFPVYKLDVVIVTGRDGSMGWDHRCLPIAMLASWDQLTVPPGAALRDCELLTADETRSVLLGLERCEALMRSLRARADSGLVV